MTTGKSHSRWRMLLVVPPLVLGVLMLVVMGNSRKPPTEVDAGESSATVRVVTASRVDLIPEATGYGEVQPARVWAAVAQVAGRVVEVHPRLRNGEILPAGTLLFRIDPVDYELKLAQARAELAELAVKEENTRASLEIERRNLAVAQREEERLTKLSQQAVASRSDVDLAERSVLTARTAIQNSENSLALIPTQRHVLEARLTQAERDLQNTAVTAPFDMRITELATEQDQYTTVGQTLFRGDAVDRVEVTAQFAMSSLRNLLAGREDKLPAVAKLQSELADFSGFRPLLRMDLGDLTAEWEAQFARLGDAVDAQTRTMGLVIAVDKPLEQVIPGRRPPLSKGMFVEVRLRGRPQSDRLVVPRYAVRDGKVYVVGRDQRLEVRNVAVLFSQGALSIISGGVQPGEQVVVSDLPTAVPGMLLSPQVDQALQDAMLSAARGES